MQLAILGGRIKSESSHKLFKLRFKHVYITVHSTDREEAAGLEEGRAEWAGGEMVRKGCQKSCEEVEKDGTAGRVGKSHHYTECQHEMHNHTQVTTQTQLTDCLEAGKLGLMTASKR